MVRCVVQTISGEQADIDTAEPTCTFKEVKQIVARKWTVPVPCFNLVIGDRVVDEADVIDESQSEPITLVKLPALDDENAPLEQVTKILKELKELKAEEIEATVPETVISAVRARGGICPDGGLQALCLAWEALGHLVLKPDLDELERFFKLKDSGQIADDQRCSARQAYSSMMTPEKLDKATLDELIGRWQADGRLTGDYNVNMLKSLQRFGTKANAAREPLIGELKKGTYSCVVFETIVEIVEPGDADVRQALEDLILDESKHAENCRVRAVKALAKLVVPDSGQVSNELLEKMINQIFSRTNSEPGATIAKHLEVFLKAGQPDGSTKAFNFCCEELNSFSASAKRLALEVLPLVFPKGDGSPLSEAIWDILRKVRSSMVEPACQSSAMECITKIVEKGEQTEFAISGLSRCLVAKDGSRPDYLICSKAADCLKELGLTEQEIADLRNGKPREGQAPELSNLTISKPGEEDNDSESLQASRMALMFGGSGTGPPPRTSPEPKPKAEAASGTNKDNETKKDTEAESSTSEVKQQEPPKERVVSEAETKAKNSLGLLPECSSQEAIKSVFKKIDADGSGTIEMGELARVMMRVSRGALSFPEIQQMFAEADFNKDGVIDVDEFLNWVFQSKS